MKEHLIDVLGAAGCTIGLALIFIATVPVESAAVPLLAYSSVVTALLLFLVFSLKRRA